MPRLSLLAMEIKLCRQAGMISFLALMGYSSKQMIFCHLRRGIPALLPGARHCPWTAWGLGQGSVYGQPGRQALDRGGEKVDVRHGLNIEYREIVV